MTEGNREQTKPQHMATTGKPGNGRNEASSNRTEATTGSQSSPTGRAILIFVDSIRRDLMRRRFPEALAPFLRIPFAGSSISEEADLHLYALGSFSEEGLPTNLTLHRQPPASFAEALESSLEDLVRSGYREIVIVGRDCPELSEEDVREAFRQLSQNQLVLGPDHRGGVYLIALKAGDQGLLRGIRWQKNTDFAQLKARVDPELCFLLEVKQDVDSWQDLVRISRSRMLRGLFDQRMLLLLEVPANRDRFAPVVKPHPKRERQRWQLPPPAIVSLCS